MSCSRAGCQESAERSITDSTTIWHILLSLTWYIFLTKFLIHHFCVKEGWWSPSYLSFFFTFIFISWRLITLQYCSGFYHTLTWISHGFTCIPHPDPPLPPPSPPNSSGSSQCTRPKHLSHASSLGWWSVSP